MLIADIFMLLYGGVLAPDWLCCCYQNAENGGEACMQTYLNFAMTVSASHYNAAQFTCETLSKFQFIAA